MSAEKTINKEELFRSLPASKDVDLLGEIRAIHEQSGKVLVILDDDPTGTQTVNGVPLLTEWSVESLKEELSKSSVFFILTNTRSMEEKDAVAINLEIGRHLTEASQAVGVDFFVLSRSDSTLRGHYPAEVDALCEGVQSEPDAVVMVPYFDAGGRYTINNTHNKQ